VANTQTPDRRSQQLLLVLMLLGTVLAVVGWYRWMAMVF
jgi:hypothetical protein